MVDATSGAPTPAGPGGPGQDGPGDHVPSCYRHPHVDAAVSCARCGRPICPDCMVDAPVGHQCPECVHDGHRSSPQVQAPWRSGSRSGVSATKVLIGLNVAVFAIGFLSGQQDRFIIEAGLRPAFVVFEDEWWRLVTSMFLHADFFHIAFNMYALWIFGEVLERQFGRGWFTLLYFASGLAAGAFVVFWAMRFGTPPPDGVDWLVPTVGASGAIFGLFGAMLVVSARRRHTVIGRQQLTSLAVLLVINLALSFGSSSISWQGHVGGLVAGAIIGLAYDVDARPASRLLAVGVVGVFAFVALWDAVGIGEQFLT